MERIYTIPLRRGTMTAPRTRRAKKAILVLAGFIRKHMKCDDFTVSEKLNEHIWSQGMRNPIMKVKVIAAKDDKSGEVSVRLFGEEVKAPVKAKKKVSKANTPMEKLQEKVTELKKPAAETSGSKASKAPETKVSSEPEVAPKEEPAKKVEAKAPAKEAEPKKAEEKSEAKKE